MVGEPVRRSAVRGATGVARVRVRPSGLAACLLVEIGVVLGCCPKSMGRAGFAAAAVLSHSGANNAERTSKRIRDYPNIGLFQLRQFR